MSTNLQMWSAIVGFCLPPLIAIIQQSHWPQRIRAIVTFLACVAAALGTVYVQGSSNFTWHRWLESTLVILVTAIATYHGLWKPTGVAPAVEEATSTKSA